MNISRRKYGALVLVFFLLAAGIALFRKRGKKRDGITVFTALTAFILRFLYILYTPTWERQHDVIGFGNEKGIGQAALIEWLMENMRLPDFDPRKRWGFFQPLLHHILSAAWLKLNLLSGIGYWTACENIQLLTLFYSLIFTWYAYRIFREMGLSGNALRLSFAAAALHPSFIMMAGSVNNDMLCHCLLIMAVYYAVRWYREGTYRTILLTGLCIGFSMMAKLSGVLAAPAVGFLFLYSFIRGGKEAWGRHIRQFCAFGAAAFPLGLFFPLRNYFLFGVPLMYMPEVGEPVGQYGMLRRIFDIRTNTPFACMVVNGDAYDEFNVPLTLMKTSLTGEYDFSGIHPLMTPLGWILLLSAVLLAGTALYATVRFSLGKSRIPDPGLRWYFLILYASGLLFYLRLAFSVPNFSSADFRYIAHLIVPEALYLGLLSKETGEKGPFTNGLACLTAVFGGSAACIYLLLGLP